MEEPLFYSFSRLLVSICSFVIAVIVFSTIPEISSIGSFMPIILLIFGFGYLYYGAYFLDRSIFFAAVADGCEESNKSILYSYKKVKINEK